MRLKNKGDQNWHQGRKRPKYEAPQAEHPDTSQDLAKADIHANHLEGFNAGIRRKLACYRRKTNTYTKTDEGLQTRLDVQWVLHNFMPFYHQASTGRRAGHLGPRFISV